MLELLAGGRTLAAKLKAVLVAVLLGSEVESKAEAHFNNSCYRQQT